MSQSNGDVIVVTGGAGYIGTPLCLDLAAAGRRVRVLDTLLHGQADVAAQLESAGVELIRGDVRDGAARESALGGARAVVHLAAIVGDPACARDPEASNEVNVEGTRALVRDAARLGVRRFVFASTCSNYGRMTDPTTPIDETGVLAPVSLYAEQKVQMEQALLEHDDSGLEPVCLRFATIYGVAPRMRFDLTVNEFTRDLWADRRLEVFGEQFWRPYVHVRDAGRAVRTVLEASADRVVRDVFNVGRSGENYRKLDLVEEIRRQTDRGEVAFVRRDEDPRDYKVSFDKVRAVLGFETAMTVPDGVAEVLNALEQKRFGDPFDGRYRNIP
ncbi:MAG TPA: NAD(P)-dependent oxidoreductase [Solirubrobacteraceae bacterium]|jgi:nucleoside-diphosphate-sugar epimerase|nr:NAD(P)-dependent oxidoreductase [Solirubrobacteraceae bacterium]